MGRLVHTLPLSLKNLFHSILCTLYIIAVTDGMEATARHLPVSTIPRIHYFCLLHDYSGTNRLQHLCPSTIQALPNLPSYISSSFCILLHGRLLCEDGGRKKTGRKKEKSHITFSGAYNGCEEA